MLQRLTGGEGGGEGIHNVQGGEKRRVIIVTLIEKKRGIVKRVDDLMDLSIVFVASRLFCYCYYFVSVETVLGYDKIKIKENAASNWSHKKTRAPKNLRLI